MRRFRRFGRLVFRISLLGSLVAISSSAQAQRQNRPTKPPTLLGELGVGAAERLLGIGRLLEQVEHQVVRRVLNLPDLLQDDLTLADRWIIARCEATVVEATEAYERYRLNDAAGAVYRFIWSDLADWYIEQIKPRLYGDVPGGDVARGVEALRKNMAQERPARWDVVDMIRADARTPWQAVITAYDALGQLGFQRIANATNAAAYDASDPRSALG